MAICFGRFDSEISDLKKTHTTCALYEIYFYIGKIFPCLLLVRAKNQGSRVGGAKTPSICQKSTFGVITLADVVNPILYGLCWLSREQASNCQIEEANQEVVTQNDLLLVLLQSSLIRKKNSTITLLNRLFCCWIFLIYSLWHCNIRQLIGGKLIGLSIFILYTDSIICVCVALLYLLVMLLSSFVLYLYTMLVSPKIS